MKNKTIFPVLFLLLLLVAGVVSVIWFMNFFTEQKPSLTNVNLRLKWLHQAQFAGNYVAQEKGFYEDEGLSINIKPVDFEDPTIDAVVNGRADFGITGADELLIARAKNIPIQAVAVIYRKNPVCAYSLKSSKITEPKDFIGKTVGIERGINVEFLYDAMMKNLSLDRSKIKEISIGYDARELLAGITDVSTGYVINEPHLAIEAGQDVNIILMADYGVNIYADVIFATEKTISENPELVEKFVRASIKGWDYALDHEVESVNATMKYATNSTRIHQTYMLKKSIPLIYSSETPLGVMLQSDWEQANSILFEQKLIDNKIDITKAFTNQFVDKLYPASKTP